MSFSLPQFRPDQKYDMPYSKPIQELFRLAQTEQWDGLQIPIVYLITLEQWQWLKKVTATNYT